MNDDINIIFGDSNESIIFLPPINSNNISSNNISSNNINLTNVSQTYIEKITPVITYKIPQYLKNIKYGTKFIQEQLNATVEYNNIPVESGYIEYKYSLSSTQVITPSTYCNKNSDKIYAVYTDPSGVYNSVNTYDTINVELNNNTPIIANKTVISNRKLYTTNAEILTNLNQTLKINGLWYIYNPSLGYFARVKYFV
jgi:hypothetical protein